MKKIIYFSFVVFLFSCQEKQSNEYAKVSGLIANNNAKEISIIGKAYKKTFSVNADGTFSDTLKIIKSGYHTFYDGKSRQTIFLSNSNNININYDFTDMRNTISVNGIGSETSNYLFKKNKFEQKERLTDYRQFNSLTKDVFDTRILALENEVAKMLSDTKIDSTLKVRETNNYKNILDRLKQNYLRQSSQPKGLNTGQVSPKFVNYQNYKGGTTSLDDFKGKFVYIDVWATWCGPCKQQIPFMKKLEKDYHKKNIAFISISTDDARRNQGSWDKAKDKWKKMIKDKKMGGIQLFADKAFNSDFIKAYGIRSIPRFILIDPYGKVVNANAPRPSQPALKTLLDGLL